MSQGISNAISNIQTSMGSNYSGYFVEKNISELVMDFINSRKEKTFTNIFYGIGILIGADIIKNIILDLVKDQKKQIIDEILTVNKNLNIFIPIKYSCGLFYGLSSRLFSSVSNNILCSYHLGIIGILKQLSM